MSTVNQTLGQEIIRVDFSRDGEVKDMKLAFSALLDRILQRAQEAQVAIDTPPSIHSAETIQAHMEVIRKNEELMRCLSEAGKLLEVAAMWAVKGITA
jgi:hypothetical protein